LLDQILQVDLDLKAETQVLRIQVLGDQGAWDFSSKVVLHLVGTLGLSLVGKLRTESAEVVLSLASDLRW
jgi:hypothetical protein